MTAGVSEGSVLPAPVKPLGLTPMIVTGTSLIVDRPSDRSWRPREFAIPEGVADHRYRGAAWHVVGRTNLATDLRPDAEHLVVVARDFVQKHALRVVADRGVRRRRVEREQITEHRILCAQMFVDGYEKPVVASSLSDDA